MRKISNYLGSILLIILITGCATTTQQASITQLTRSTSEAKIILMPLDVELSLLTAGGVSEPNAEWTRSALENMQVALDEAQSELNVVFTPYTRPEQTDPSYSQFIELERLHEAVGQAILFHKYQVPLPSKKDVFDWTLGETAQVLKENNGADYALFLYVRDSYSSAGRVFLQLAAAAAGYGMQGGTQVGFASLVDLNTGDIVWFNFLVSTTGDLRTVEPAKRTVDNLLDGFPT